MDNLTALRSARTCWVARGGRGMMRDAPSDPAATRPSALVAGATGLVGREILQGLLADPGVAAVHVWPAAPGLRAPLTAHVVSFQLPPCRRWTRPTWRSGTTIKVAGSQAAFRAVDFDANLAVAGRPEVAGARRLGLVSAMGADSRSSIFYNRVKGELEEALAGLGYEAW